MHLRNSSKAADVQKSCCYGVLFVCKEGSAESERARLKEVAYSYIVDERVGFAEPASGVELYVCPPDSKTREMLAKVLPKDQLDALNSIDNGLIGVIVWRKPHITSTISPKHNSKKQNSTSRRNQEKDANVVDVNVMSKHHSIHSQSLPCPADQMRELVHKYGQPETISAARGVVLKSWNDDDNDMPEWHPDDAKPPQPLQQPQLQAHGVFMRNNSVMQQQQPISRAHMMQQTQYPHMPVQAQTLSMQPQVNVMPQAPWRQQQQHGQWMAPKTVYQPNNGQPWHR